MFLRRIKRRKLLALAMALLARNGPAWGWTHGTSSSPTGTTLTMMAVTSTSGSAQTNVPISIGLPIAPGALASSAIQVLDDDGVTVLAVQEDNRASDLTPNVRYTGLTVILPSLGAGATKNLTVQTVAGSPATGTDITAAQILATGYDYVVTINDRNGTTYTAKASFGLNAGTYSSTTAHANFGKFKGGGGLVTSYVVMVIPTTGTTGVGTPHAQLRVMFEVVAWKAATGAVSGGNPILAIRTDRIIESGWIQQSGAVTDDWYGLTDTCGSNTVAWANSTPTQTLTLGHNSDFYGGATLTASSSLFTVNSSGSLVSDGTGYGVIVAPFTSGTLTSINIVKAFAGSSLTSGNYTIFGISHPYGARYRQRFWYSGLAQPAFNANLGAAWNGGTLTGGPFTYIAATKMTLNYSTPASAVPGLMGGTANDLTNFTNQGTNPASYQQTNIGANQFGIGIVGSGNGLAGDLTMSEGSTGDRIEIGVIPDYAVAGMIYYDANAMTRIIGNADKSAQQWYNIRDPATGLQMVIASGSDWKITIDPGHPFGTPWVNFPFYNSGNYSLTNYELETAHMPEANYVPYLLTGDWCWLDAMSMRAQSSWLFLNPGYSGSGLNRILNTPVEQQRAIAWNMRSLWELACMIPDASSPAIGWSKSHVKTWLSNHYTATNSGTAGTNPFPGSNISYANGATVFAPSSLTFPTNGPHWSGTLGGNGGGVISHWMGGYLINSMFHAKEMGMLDTNGLAWLTWQVEDATGFWGDATVDHAYMAAAYWADVIYPSATAATTWGEHYRGMALDIYAAYGNSRTLSGTVTLSATSGTAITAQFPTGTFAIGGTTFYQNGWVQSQAGGQAKITSIAVNSPAGKDTVTMSTSGTDVHDGQTVTGSTFASTTLAGNAYFIPCPYPGDTRGAEMAAEISGGYSYFDIHHAVLIQANHDGYAGASTALTGFNALGPPPWAAVKWQITARP